MILGVVFGTYSSIYIANPILVLLKVSQRTIVKEEKINKILLLPSKVTLAKITKYLFLKKALLF